LWHISECECQRATELPHRIQTLAIKSEGRFSQELVLAAISRIDRLDDIKAVLAEQDIQMQLERKLNMVVNVLLTIAKSIFSHVSIGHVMQNIAQGLRYVWCNPDYRVACDSAITYRRYQLGARPLVALFHRVYQPISTTQTKGAFLFSLSLMAIDGSTEDVANTPDNGAVLGRPHGSRGGGASPQVQGVYLVECGTHAIVHAGLWRCHVREKVSGFRLLRSVQPDMLVMWDRGFHD
jgi:hypothetical protein